MKKKKIIKGLASTQQKPRLRPSSRPQKKKKGGCMQHVKARLWNPFLSQSDAYLLGD